MSEVAPKDINRDTVRTLMRRGGQLVDVLSKDEYEKIHLAGAVNIPIAMIDRTTADRIKWDRAVIVYSSDYLDDQSARAAWKLASMGFTQVFRYTAGKADWIANGFPAEGSEARVSGVGDLADLDVPTCKRSERVNDIRARVQKDGWNTCVVVNDALVVLGLLRSNALERANPSWTAEEAMERNPKTYRLNTSLEEATKFMHDNHIDSVLVTTTDGTLFGLLKLEETGRSK